MLDVANAGKSECFINAICVLPNVMGILIIKFLCIPAISQVTYIIEKFILIQNETISSRKYREAMHIFIG